MKVGGNGKSRISLSSEDLRDRRDVLLVVRGRDAKAESDS